MNDAPSPQHDGSPADSNAAQRSVSSRELLGGERELLIDHEGQIYRLRVTRNGKLILHK